MNLIFSVLGSPPKTDMDFITNDKAAEYIQGLAKQPKQPFSKLYPNANPLALDLMEQMLAFNPNKRITIESALAHPYFKGLHNIKTEPSCSEPFDFEFEKVEMTKETLQDFMFAEIQFYRPELKDKTWRVTKEEAARHRAEKEKEAKRQAERQKEKAAAAEKEKAAHPAQAPTVK